MKRLFILRRGKSGAVIKDDDGQVMYFGSKPEAKAARNSIGGNTVVSVGIDHKLYKGNR
jgi:hypothetical protein